MYRLLHARLTDHPELMDGDFLLDLQKSLQRMARAEGVDVSDHGAWDAWLGNTPVSCEVRVAGRRVIES
ncbi:MAG: hypothetical protein K1X57_03635 [Gemmataceae bacterium]|nr:hypothetical protein [Gemmataceae bacterium]